MSTWFLLLLWLVLSPQKSSCDSNEEEKGLPPTEVDCHYYKKKVAAVTVVGSSADLQMLAAMFARSPKECGQYCCTLNKACSAFRYEDGCEIYSYALASNASAEANVYFKDFNKGYSKQQCPALIDSLNPCQSGTTFHEKSCYTVQEVEPALSYYDANWHCLTEYEADLTSITSESENNFIIGLGLPAKTKCWIGLRKSAGSSRFTWTDGQKNIDYVNESMAIQEVREKYDVCVSVEIHGFELAYQQLECAKELPCAICKLALSDTS